MTDQQPQTGKKADSWMARLAHWSHWVTTTGVVLLLIGLWRDARAHADDPGWRRNTASSRSMRRATLCWRWESRWPLWGR
jgi:hypothetical protein